MLKELVYILIKSTVIVTVAVVAYYLYMWLTK